MKKFIAFAISIIAIVACAFITACKSENVEPVIFKADSESFDFNNKTLLDYMNYLQDEGEFTFVMGSDGMIKSINGKENTLKSYWMLYTDDAENANNAWGTYEHEGVIYGSAIAGAREQKLTENCTYIWVYTTFD